MEADAITTVLELVRDARGARYLERSGMLAKALLQGVNAVHDDRRAQIVVALPVVLDECFEGLRDSAVARERVLLLDRLVEEGLDTKPNGEDQMVIASYTLLRGIYADADQLPDYVADAWRSALRRHLHLHNFQQAVEVEMATSAGRLPVASDVAISEVVDEYLRDHSSTSALLVGLMVAFPGVRRPTLSWLQAILALGCAAEPLLRLAQDLLIDLDERINLGIYVEARRGGGSYAEARTRLRRNPDRRASIEEALRAEFRERLPHLAMAGVATAGRASTVADKFDAIRLHGVLLTIVSSLSAYVYAKSHRTQATELDAMPKEREGLVDSVVAVTGAAQGIGWAIAAALVRRGARVHICDISEPDLLAASERVQALGWASQLKVTKCDVTDVEALESWLSEIQREEGRIDILVNNAAFVRWVDVVDMSYADIMRTMDVGFRAMAHATGLVLPAMLGRRHGCIVNIGSSAGKVFVGGSSAAYAGMKAAVDGYTQTLQGELRDTGVRAILVRPGVVVGTNFLHRHVPSKRLPGLTDWLPHTTPDTVAERVVSALVDKTDIVNVPKWLSSTFVAYELVPSLFRTITRWSGQADRDYRSKS